MSNKIKHLEFIQNVITRMGQNSFLIKGWCITLLIGLLALHAHKPHLNLFWSMLILLPTFWELDGFFLMTERRYRALYDRVRILDEVAIDFSMKINVKDCSWHDAVFSQTLKLFYLPLIIIVVLLFMVKT
ncbi:hypothetical protein HUU62_17310 [Rhodoferax sp. 4810]|uniref:Uncharacterized protein n=1 Tax=Thiospirillum jenense TaxID=1653858 RepID=A0A839HGL5_9GAMM|nr:hypothetical protein [Thiospirillum jenense]MBB1076165.1 hypothetical protein [Rhodoferax jenense]MBB1126049.1 hypothetical protein [Thiospirillum jenense]